MGHSQAATLEAPGATDLVRAAGGLVVRRAVDDRCEVALVHRPTRADWTFPKGKLEAGECFEEAALREVAEETGLHCRLGRFIGHTEYRDRKGRPKVVAYWVMHPLRGRFQPNDEVDEVCWLGLADATSRLTYARDRTLVTTLAATDEVTRLG